MDLHNHFVDAIVEELPRLNGTDFEYLCRSLMEVLTDSEIILKGHNLYMKPVGYSVDLIKDSKTVGQCGTDERYYTDGKTLSDIEGCIANSPGCRNIYLFGNKRATGGEFQTLQREIKIKYERYNVELYDAQRIGEAVYNNIFKTRLVESILQYLPKAKHYYLIMPQTNNVPVLSSSYVSRPEETEIVKILDEQGFVQLYGLSGIGKSLLALSVAGRICDDYDTVLWFDGEKVNVNELSSVYTQRLGENINLEAVLNQFKVLLVADNMNVNVNTFKDNFTKANKKDSRCIITSLQKNIDEAHAFEVSFVDKVISKQILCQFSLPQNESQLEIILNQISGYPLLLDLARRAVENGNFTWDELISLSNMTGIPDEERNMAFAERIVGRYKDDYAELFNTLVLLGGVRVSSDFLKSIDVFKTKDLVRFAVLQANEEYSYQIHIVVLDAIRRVMSKDLDVPRYTQCLLIYLKQHVASRDAGLYTFMAVHRDTCIDVAGRLDPANELRHYVVLAACYTKDTYREHDKYIKMVDELSLDINRLSIDLNLLIEKMEISQNQKYIMSGKDDSVKEKILLADIKILKELSVTTDKQKSLQCHHIGKWYMNIKNYDDAESYLKESLSLIPTSYNSMLQLARLYNKKNLKDDVKRMVEAILDEKTLSDVPVSVLLSTYGLLAPSKYADMCKTYLDSYIDTFIATVYASLSQGYTHTYQELAKLSRHLAYNHSEIYNQLCARLPLPLDIDKDEQVRENYGNIISAQYRYCDNDEGYRNKIFHVAEMYLLMTTRDKDIKRKALFDLYIAGGKADEAIKEAQTYDNQDDIYLHQGLSKVYKIKADYSEALKHIDFSISHEDDAYVGHRAAFRHDKAQCLRGLDNEKWKDVMIEAIEMQPNEKVKKQWCEELKNVY